MSPPPLPDSILLAILSLLPPPSLAVCLRLNRHINHLLSDPSIKPSPWTLSRKAYLQNAPRPLLDKDELDMFRLIYSRECQFCGRQEGQEEVSIIWQFGIRSCPECIKEHCEREFDLLFSPFPSFLIPGLPPAFFQERHNQTDQSQSHSLSLHYISSLTLRSSPPPAPVKLFYKPHIASLTAQFDSVKALGPAAADEWLKGLTSRSAEATANAARWEQWEAAGGLKLLEVSREETKNESKYESKDANTISVGVDTPDSSLKNATSKGSTATLSGPSLPAKPATPDTAQQPPQPHQLTAREAAEAAWDAIQTPLKTRLLTYADAYIRDHWRSGATVTKKNCARFAAQTLLHVRRRFYADLADQDARAIHDGKPIEYDKEGEPPRRKVLLENMKFVYDSRVKPITEKFLKELFLCNGCCGTNATQYSNQGAAGTAAVPHPANLKYFGFEGVIQHYAAKHTSALSLGSVVVHWRAEWPEVPPFHPEPDRARAVVRGLNAHAQQTQLQQTQGQGLGQVPVVGAGAGAPPFARHAFGAGPMPVPAPGPATALPFRAASEMPAHHPGYPDTAAPPMTYSPYTPHPPPSFSAHQSKPDKAPTTARTTHQTRLDAIARAARSVWNLTSGIRDIPTSVRAHVLIHHVTTSFEATFPVAPYGGGITEDIGDLTLALFAEGLQSHPQMKPLRGLAGLCCKVCNFPSPGGTAPVKPGTGDERLGRRKGNQGASLVGSWFGKNKPRLFSFAGLLAHFQKLHVERAGAGVTGTGTASGGGNGGGMEKLDWRYDMLLLPDHATIAGLADAQGMDAEKLRLVALAFPQVFVPPQPQPQLQLPVEALGVPVAEPMAEPMGVPMVQEPQMAASPVYVKHVHPHPHTHPRDRQRVREVLPVEEEEYFFPGPPPPPHPHSGMHERHSREVPTFEHHQQRQRLKRGYGYGYAEDMQLPPSKVRVSSPSSKAAYPHRVLVRGDKEGRHDKRPSRPASEDGEVASANDDKHKGKTKHRTMRSSRTSPEHTTTATAAAHSHPPPTSSPQTHTQSQSQSLEGMTAAERFLNTFDPKEELQGAGPKPAAGGVASTRETSEGNVPGRRAQPREQSVRTPAQRAVAARSEHNVSRAGVRKPARAADGGSGGGGRGSVPPQAYYRGFVDFPMHHAHSPHYPPYHRGAMYDDPEMEMQMEMEMEPPRRQRSVVDVQRARRYHSHSHGHPSPRQFHAQVPYVRTRSRSPVGGGGDGDAEGVGDDGIHDANATANANAMAYYRERSPQAVYSRAPPGAAAHVHPRYAYRQTPAPAPGYAVPMPARVPVAGGRHGEVYYEEPMAVPVDVEYGYGYGYDEYPPPPPPQTGGYAYDADRRVRDVGYAEEMYPEEMGGMVPVARPRSRMVYRYENGPPPAAVPQRGGRERQEFVELDYGGEEAGQEGEGDGYYVPGRTGSAVGQGQGQRGRQQQQRY